MVHLLTGRDSQVLFIEPGIFSFQVAPRALNKTTLTKKNETSEVPVLEFTSKFTSSSKKILREESPHVIDDIGETEELKPSQHQGPRIEIDKKSLLFQTKPGITNQQTLHISNNGSTVIYYKWEKIQPEKTSHSSGKFYFSDSNGILLPGTSKLFTFTFVTNSFGVFTENWELKTKPPIIWTPTLLLTGMSSVEDGMKEARQEVEHKINEREKYHGAESIFLQIISKLPLKELKEPQLEKEAEFMETFLRQNPDTFMFLSTNCVSAIKSLANRVFKDESVPQSNFSLIEINESIWKVSDPKERSILLKELNKISDMGSKRVVEFSPVPIIYSLTYKLFLDLFSVIPQCAKSEREILGLPPKQAHSARENLEKKEEEEKSTKADKGFNRKQRRKKETLLKAESQVSAHEFQETDKKLEEEYKQRLTDKISTLVKEMIQKFVDISEGMPKKEKQPEPPKEEIPIIEVQIERLEEEKAMEDLEKERIKEEEEKKRGKRPKRMNVMIKKPSKKA